MSEREPNYDLAYTRSVWVIPVDDRGTVRVIDLRTPTCKQPTEAEQGLIYQYERAEKLEAELRFIQNRMAQDAARVLHKENNGPLWTQREIAEAVWKIEPTANLEFLTNKVTVYTLYRESVAKIDALFKDRLCLGMGYTVKRRE